MATLTGTGNNDTLTGGGGDDTILGLGGNDSLTGGGGNDYIDGGAGNDIVRGGLGNDTVIVGRGDDVNGEDGDDILTYTGSDALGATTYVDGGLNTDTFIIDLSGAFDAISSYNSGVSGGIGGIYYYNIETLSISGGSASDSLVAGNGNDTVSGGTGNDTLVGGLGVNDLTGGAGIDFGAVDLTGRTANLNLVFISNAGNQNIGGSAFHSIEGLGLINGSGNDNIDVSDESTGSRLQGMAGNDTLIGGDFADLLDGGDDADEITFGRLDTANGGNGDDSLLFTDVEANGGTTYVDGQVGTDYLKLDFSAATDALSSYNSGVSGGINGIYYYNIDLLYIAGGSARDSLVAGNGNDTLVGGKGNDTLVGGLGVNDLTGGAGADFGSVDLTGRAANLNLVFISNAGNQNIGGSAFHSIEGLGLINGSGNDNIDVSDESTGSRLQGMAGNDTLIGGDFADLLDGGDDADEITFGRLDTANGGNGDDSLLFTDVEANGGTTYVDGQAGTDYLKLDFSAATDALSSYNSGVSGGINGIYYYNIDRLYVAGGSASDSIQGGVGDDTLLGGKGHDRLDAGTGVTAQLVDGGLGRDIGLVDISTLGTNQVVNFKAGVDIVLGVTTLTQIEGLGLKTGSGDDKINVSKEKLGSIVYGGFGDDTITGGAAYADLLDGQGDDDLITFGRLDTANGGNGDDVLKFSDTGVGGTTYADGQADIDRLVADFSKAVDAISGYNSGVSGGIAGLYYYNIEQVSLIGGSASDSLQAGVGADTLTGGGGNDSLDGGKGANVIDGGAGIDLGLVDLSDTAVALNVNFTGASINIGANSLSGVEGLGVKAGSANDVLKVTGETRGSVLYGGLGADTITGGSAYADYLDGQDGDDLITLGRGDTANGGNDNDELRLTDNASDLTTTYADGQAGSDLFVLNMSGATANISSYNGGVSGGIAGVYYYNMDMLSFQTGSGADTVAGGSGSDTLSAGAGADSIDGGASDDFLTGGLGRDTFTGGSGNDRFRFFAEAESANATPDLITDFTSGDKIDLSGIDARAGGADNAFTFIGTAAFSGTSGELRYSQSGGYTYVSGDTDGNGSADFTIALTGTITLAGGDFVL